MHEKLVSTLIIEGKEVTVLNAPGKVAIIMGLIFGFFVWMGSSFWIGMASCMAFTCVYWWLSSINQNLEERLR